MNTVGSTRVNYEHDFVIKVHSYSHKANVHSDNWLQPGQHSERSSALSQGPVLLPVHRLCRDTLTCTFFRDTQKWTTKALTLPGSACRTTLPSEYVETRRLENEGISVKMKLKSIRVLMAPNAGEYSVSTGPTHLTHPNTCSSKGGSHSSINVSNRRPQRTTTTCALRDPGLVTGALRCVQLTPPTTGTTHGLQTGRNSRLTIPKFLHKDVNGTISICSHHLWCRIKLY